MTTKPRSKIFTIAVRVAVILAASWLGLVVLAVLFQDKLVYHPVKELDLTPGNFGREYEEIWLSAADGTRLNAWHLPASGPGREGVTTLIVFHGNAGNLSTAVHRLMGYADLGFDVFMVDYHGFGKSGGFPSEANLYAAADALWDHVVENGNVPPKAIVILGYSLGGAVASYLAEKHPDTAGLILESTFTSLAEVAADFFPYLPCGLIVGNAYDTADRLHAIHMPLLVIHGPGDELVAYTHGKALYDAFTGRKEFLEINDDHNLGFLLSGDSYYQGIAQFMEKVVERTD